MFKVFLCLLAVTSSLSVPTSPVSNDHPVAPAQEQHVAQPAIAPIKPQVASGVPVTSQVVVDSPRSARAYDAENEVPGSGIEDNLLEKLNSKCTQRDPSACAMLKLIAYMNRLLKKANIEIADNIEITTTSSFVQVQAPELPRSLSNEPEETQLTQLMTNKMMAFVKSRALRLHLLPTTDLVITSQPDADGNLNMGMALDHLPPTETGRGKNKNMGGLMAAMVMKMGMLGALAFKGLALLVGKALLLSKIALLLAVVLGLKKLFSQQKHVTYEVVAQPHHSHAHVEHSDHGHSSGGGGGGHDSYSSGWSRSLGVSPVGKGDGQDLAYGSYSPQ